MSKQEIEVVVDEIVSAINAGRFNEAVKKFYETMVYGLLSFIEPRVDRYDFQRFYNMLETVWTQEIANENV